MKYRESKRFVIVYSLLLLAIALWGCNSTQSTDPVTRGESGDSDMELTSTITSEPSVVLSATPLSTASATYTPTALLNQANTSTPTATLTQSTVTPTPILTPLPMIPSNQRGTIYNELMNNNGDCELPCWWGFEPGVSHIEYVKQLYTSLGAHINERDFGNGRTRVTALFIDPQIENGEQVVHTFYAQNGIFSEALVDADNPAYQITPLLEQLGLPTEIWMWTIPEPNQGILPIRFRLYFPDKGVFVLYAIGGQKTGDVVQACFDEIGGTTLLLWDPTIWDPEGTKEIFDRANEGGTAFTLEGHPIEEVSNWNVEQFYTILSETRPTGCLETPSNIWPPP